MALSGSFNTTGYDGRYLTFSWTATQSIDSNHSIVSWTLKGAGGGSVFYKAGPITLYIEGEPVYSSNDRIQLYSGTLVASGTKIITHSANGSKSFSASASAAIYSSGVNCSGSGNWELDPIPRGALLKTAPNFNDEDNPTITYENYLGDASNVILEACIALYDSVSGYWVGSLGANYRAISKTGTSYTFDLTDEERDKLRKGVTDGYTGEVKFFVRTTVNKGTANEKIYLSSQSRTLTLVNAELTLVPYIYDGNRVTQGLTGTDGVLRFIAGESNLGYSVGATASKGATITSYSVKCGDYSSNSSNGMIYGVQPSYREQNITISATDSRGNTKTVVRPLNMVWYYRPDAYLVEDSVSTSANTLYFDIMCYWFDRYFDDSTTGAYGGVKNEAVLEYKVKYGEQESGWITANPENRTKVPDSDGYLWKVSIGGLDHLVDYKVQIRISDKITTVDVAEVSEEYTIKMTPVFDWSREDFAVNVPTRLNDGLYLLDNEGEHSQVMKYVRNDEYDENLGLIIGLDNYEKSYELGETEGDSKYSTSVRGDNVELSAIKDVFIKSGRVYINPVDDVYIHNKPITDFVIESGDNGSYAYRLWASGKMEAWRSSASAVSVNANREYGSLWYSEDLSLTTNGSASQFVAVQNVQLTLDKTSGYGLWFPVMAGWSLSNGAVTVNYVAVNPTEIPGYVRPYVYILGKWR
jgi:hypothetical protein